MACRYRWGEKQEIQDLCNRNRLVGATMLSAFRDQAAIAELEPLLERYDQIIEKVEGCPLLLAEIINNLALAYQREGRTEDYAQLQERVRREAPYFARQRLMLPNIN